jgi:cysteine desulfurase
MDRDRTNQLLTWIENIVAEQQAVISELFKLTTPKRRAVIADDIPALQQVVAQEEKLLARLQELEQIFLGEMEHASVPWQINGDRVRGIAGLLNVSFPGARSEDLVTLCDLEGLAISAGSACHAGAVEASPVLEAMGYDGAVARSAVRVSFGKTSTEEEARQAAGILRAVAARVAR